MSSKQLGEAYGITITHAWSAEMYAHNDRVMQQRRAAVRAALIRSVQYGTESEVRQIAKAVCGHGHADSFPIDRIIDDTLLTLKGMVNHWMHSDCWPALCDAGFIPDREMDTPGFVGYKML